MSIRKAVLIGAMSVGIMGTGATAAFAGVNPTPTQPTVTPTYTHTPPPVPVPTPRSALWQFDFTGANIDGLSLNDVRGTSPILMSRWSEQDLNPFTSRFTSPNHLNSVTLRHNRLPLPNINLSTCTATFDQLGNFRIINGTGTGAGFRVVPGTDIYLLRGTVSVDRVARRGYYGRHLNTVCPLQFTTPWQLRANVESNGLAASLTDFDIQGNAQLVRINPLPAPYPTGPGHFAPTVNPDNQPVIPGVTPSVVPTNS